MERITEEVPAEFLSALEMTRRLSAQMFPGKAKHLLGQIEAGIREDIERIKNEHEEFLHER